MPALSIVTNAQLTITQKQIIMEKTAGLITLLSGKKPERTMVDVQDNVTMMYDCSIEECLKIHLELYKPSPAEEKQEYVRQLFEMLHQETGIPLSRMYLTISEYDSWGSEGKLRQ